MTPDGLLDLMGKALIKTGFLKNSSMYGMPAYLHLVESPMYTCVDTSKSVPVYDLKQAKTETDKFLSFICDYERGELHYQILDKRAEFCFTITMNGCTFGVGAPNKDGCVMVTHGNQADVKDAPDVPTGSMFEKQRTLAHAWHGDSVALLEPSTYRPTGKENISTFGVRKGSDWKFHYQSYRYLGSQKFELVGLFPWVSSSSIV